MLRVRSSAAHVRFQKLNFIVHVSLIVCVITFRVIVDIRVGFKCRRSGEVRAANRRTSATTDDVPVAISKTITNFDNSKPRLSVYIYLYCAMDAVLRMGKCILWENITCAVYSERTCLSFDAWQPVLKKRSHFRRLSGRVTRTVLFTWCDNVLGESVISVKWCIPYINDHLAIVDRCVFQKHYRCP